MDARFGMAVTALKAGDVDGLRGLLQADPDLAKARSSCGHPTLLQCLVVELPGSPNHVEAVRALVEARADVDAALVAAASVDNAPAAAALLDAGAAIDGRGGWSALEEALYWSSGETVRLLLERGAAVRSLRTAAALGRTDLIDGFFEADGALRPEAGEIDWPFGDPTAASNRASGVQGELRRKWEGWTRTPQAVLNNAFVFACMHGQLAAARLLLERGAEVNATPEGFDFDGTALHYAAMNGHRETVLALLDWGADPGLRDPKVGGTPAGWAAHGGQPKLAAELERLAARPS